MHDFIQQHRSLLLSTAYLVAGLLALGYSVFYSNLEVGRYELGVMTGTLGKESQALKALEQAREVKQQETEEGLDKLPQFLQRINSIAKKNQVIIRKLTPDPGNRFKFIIEIIDDYYTFLRFTLELESLDVVVNDIQVRPYNPGEIPPSHFISFSITPRNNAQPLAGERIDRLTAMVDEKDKRNPFQRFAYDRDLTTVKAEIDLTWLHKLSGTGRDGQGNPYATIDRKDYLVGNELDGMKVVQIESDRVYLTREGPDGSQRFVLKFRRSAK